MNIDVYIFYSLTELDKDIVVLRSGLSEIEKVTFIIFLKINGVDILY